MNMSKCVGVLIGYNGHEGWNRLECAEKDPAFIRPTYVRMGYAIPEAAVLTGLHATRENLKIALRSLSNGHPEKLLLHFSGHGAHPDGTIAVLFARSKQSHDGLVRITEIESDIRDQCPTVRQLVCVLDACRVPINSAMDTDREYVSPRGFSEASLHDVDFRWSPARHRGALEDRPKGGPERRVLLLGCQARSRSYESENHGNFTEAIAKSIANWQEKVEIRGDELVEATQRILSDRQRPACLGDPSLRVRDLGVEHADPRWPRSVDGSLVELSQEGDLRVLLTAKGDCHILGSKVGTVEAVVPCPVSSYALVRNGPEIVTLCVSVGGAWLRKWCVDPAGLKEIDSRTAEGSMGRIRLNPSGNLLAALWKKDHRANEIGIFSMSDWCHPISVPDIPNVRQIEWLDDDSVIIGTDTLICIRGVHASNHWKHELKAFGPPSQIAAARDGSHVAWSTLDGTVAVLELATKRMLQPLRHPVPVTALAFDPSGIHLAVGCADGSLHIRQVAKLQAGSDSVQLSGIVTTLTFDHEAGYFVGGTSRGRIFEWRLRSRAAQGG
jgi:WD40 repeat protein